MRFSYTFIYASTAGCYKFYYSTMHKNVKMCYCLQVLKGLIMLCYALNSPSYFLRFDFKLHISIKTAQQMFFKWIQRLFKNSFLELEVQKGLKNKLTILFTFLFYRYIMKYLWILRYFWYFMLQNVNLWELEYRFIRCYLLSLINYLLEFK